MLNARKVKSAPKAGPAQEPIEAGSYPARLVQLIDLGIQPQRPYQGQEKPPIHTILTTYELVDEFCVGEDGEPDEEKPRWLSEEFPFHSLDAELAKSTKRYYALDPKEVNCGDWSLNVTLPVNVTVVANAGKGKHVGKTFNNIAATSAMRSKDAKSCAELVNPPKVFMLDEPDMEVFSSLPEWLQDKIKSNLNYRGSELEGLIGGSGVTEEGVPEAPAEDAKKKDVRW